MSRRKHPGKPTAALWMLVATVDAALLLARVGVLALVVLAGAAVTAVPAVLVWRRMRRDGGPRVPESILARVPIRRR